MEEKEYDQLQAVWVAAGALAIMASSLDRAAVVYSMVKQWRSWVFVVLNILLLAILFTSKKAALTCSNAEECDDVDSKIERKKRVRKEEEWLCWGEGVEDEDEDHRNKVMKSGDKKKYVEDVEEPKEKIIECEVSEKPTPPLLSNEELNERVEAFIATFRRQYLVSDKSTSRVYNSPAAKNVLPKGISV